MTCTHCGSQQLFRSHRKGAADYLLSALFLYPYRCHACQARTYNRSRTKAESVTRNLGRIRLQILVYGSALLCALVLVYFVMKERVPASD